MTHTEIRDCLRLERTLEKLSLDIFQRQSTVQVRIDEPTPPGGGRIVITFAFDFTTGNREAVFRDVVQGTDEDEL